MCPPPSGRTGNIKTVGEFIAYPEKDILGHLIHRSCDTGFKVNQSFW
jgi:hypothetical protein